MSKLTKVLIALAGVVLVAGLIEAAAVFAATPTPTPAPTAKTTLYDQFVSKLATALNLDQQTVKNGIATAEKGIVADALKAGKITQQQADQADKRIDSGGVAAPGFLGRGLAGPRGVGPMAGPRMMIGGLNAIKAAANYLGISQQTLMTQLRQGKSLADIVGATPGKTVDGLKSAITASVKSTLDQAVTNGKMTQARETTILNNLSSMLDKLINNKFQARPANSGQGFFFGHGTFSGRGSFSGHGFFFGRPNQPNNSNNSNQPQS